MSANIFGDDDDDFVLAPGSDGSEPARNTPPQRPAPQQGGLPKTGGASALPRRTSTAPKASGLPPRAALPPRTQSSLPPQVKRDTGMPQKPASKLPPRKAIPAPLPAPEPVYEEPAYEEPAYEEPVYEAPEPVYAAPEPVYTPAPEPVYEEPAYEEPAYEEPEASYEPEPAPVQRESNPRRAPQRYPSQQIENIRNQSRRDDYDLEDMNDRTENRRNFNQSFDEDEAPRRRVSEEVEESKPGKGKKKKTTAQAKKEGKKEKKPSKYAGGRKSVLFVRIGAGVAVLALMGQGVNSIVNPPEFPTQAQFMSVVNENLGVTEFPLDNGNAFVMSFTKEYMNMSPDASNDRRERLREYADDNLVSVLGNGNAEVSQKIVDGPVIVGSKAKDDQNAVYTVGVKVNVSWIYLEVPVYYDKDKLAFVVSGTPSFTTPPVKAEAPDVKSEYEIDAKLATEITPNAESFFTAWGESDEEGLSRYTTKDADVETKAGLQRTATFSKLQEFEVEAKDEEDPTANTRKGTAQVVWTSTVDPKITFTQDYELELFKQPDGRWYVADITGGVTQK